MKLYDTKITITSRMDASQLPDELLERAFDNIGELIDGAFDDLTKAIREAVGNKIPDIQIEMNEV
jgi:hypothetical protein